MTNRVIISDIDKGEFYNRFNFYQMKIENNYRDTVRKIRKLKPLFFIQKKGRYIIASKKELDLQKFSLSEFKQLNNYTIFDMALRALAAVEYGEDFFSSKLYYVIKKFKYKIVAVVFNLKYDVLSFGVRTFMYKPKIKGTYGYELKGNKIVPSESKKEVFITESDGKNSVDFFRFYKDKNFAKSKMYALYEVTKRLKKTFPEIKWEFEKVDFETYKVSEHLKKKKTDKLKDLFKKEIKKINIVNYTGYSIEMLEFLLKKENIEYEISSKLTSGYNITITKSKSEYNEGEDPYHKGETQDMYIQNITDEVLKSLSPSVFETILKELIIQKEIKTKKLLLPEHKPSKKFRFFEKINDDIYGVEIDNEKLTFNITPPELNLEKGEFAIIMDENINIIKNSGMHLIFDTEVLGKAKEKDNLRNKKFGIIDKLNGIKYKNNLYAVGIVGNPQTILKKGFPIRKIEVLKGALLRDEILGMLKEFFVRYKNITVYPYPKKYIREYYKHSI